MISSFKYLLDIYIYILVCGKYFGDVVFYYSVFINSDFDEGVLELRGE